MKLSLVFPTGQTRTHLSTLEEDVSSVACFLSSCFMLPIILAPKQLQDSCRDANEKIIVVGTTGF